MLTYILRKIITVLVYFFFRPKVYYVNKSLQGRHIKEPSILICNHIHHLDGPLIGTLLRKNRLYFLAAKDRFDNKALSWLMSHCNCIPIDRHDLDTRWIHQSLDLLKKEHASIAIYPEGKHGKNGDILPFHSGVTTLAVLAHVPLLFVYIDGPYNFIFGKRAKLIIDKPFLLDAPTNGLTAEYVQETTLRLHEHMLELQKEFYKQQAIEK